MFFEKISTVYEAFMQRRKRAKVDEDLVPLAELIAKRLGWSLQIEPINLGTQAVQQKDKNDKIMVAMSGGLDSTFLAAQLKDKGEELIGVHINGLNRQYDKYEREAAKKAAAVLGIPYRAATFKTPNQKLADNPVKNQLVLSIMLDMGIRSGVHRFAVGSDWGTPISESNINYTITDSQEVNKLFWDVVKKFYPSAELIFIEQDIKKAGRLEYLSKNKNLLACVSSCISPTRFREKLHEGNERKYGVKLLPHRCGSSYKCSMEYILLTHCGYYAWDKEFIDHCWEVLATSETSHRRDLFAKNLPEGRRMKNLLNYGS